MNENSLNLESNTDYTDCDSFNLINENKCDITNDIIDSKNEENKDNYFNSIIKIHNATYLIKSYIFPYILIILGFLFYVLSLEGCSNTFMECLQIIEESKIHLKLVKFLILSAILFSIQILLIQYKYFESKLSIFSTMLTLIYLIFFIDNGSDLKYHGSYNRVVLIALNISIFSFANVVIFTINQCLKSYKRRLIIFISIIVISIILLTILNYKIKDSCFDWDVGMKNVKIDNGSFCHIKKPKICQQQLLSNIFDFSYYFGEDCNKIGNNQKKELLRFFTDKNIKSIGFPRTESWDYLDKGHDLNYQYNVLDELIDMNDSSVKNILKDRVEITVNYDEFNDDIGIAKLKLKFDKYLAEKRKKIFNSKNVLTKNVFILFIDSVSRVHFKRKLPKTFSWIEKFYNSPSNINVESFQFLKYHGTGTWTNINMIPANFGIPAYTNERADYFVKYYKEAGYVTGSSMNMCNREMINLDNSMTNFNWVSFDHEFFSFFCDTNFTPTENPFPIMNGPYSIRKKCLYGKPTTEWAVDYARQFWKAYLDSPKLFRIDIIDSHEGTGEVIKYSDEILFNFLLDFENYGYLKDTTFYILTDHHFTLPGYFSFFETEDWKSELTLPFLSIILPKNLEMFDKIKDNLKYNENIFSTPYDLHSTFLSNFIKNDYYKTKKGESLFFNKFSIDPKKRSCKQISIKKEWCRCSEEYE